MTTIDVVTIGVDGTLTPETIDRGCAALQERVGGYIEAVTSDDGKVTLWINEEGKLINLPVNELGTMLWHLVSPQMNGVDVLCGAVVVTGGVDSEGETMSIPDGLRQVLERVAEGVRLLATGQTEQFDAMASEDWQPTLEPIQPGLVRDGQDRLTGLVDE